MFKFPELRGTAARKLCVRGQVSGVEGVVTGEVALALAVAGDPVVIDRRCVGLEAAHPWRRERRRLA
jgi:hypothetical protein